MIEKEIIIKHLKDHEERQIALKTLNKAEYVLKNFTVGYTDFYDPYQISICVPLLNQIPEIDYSIEGGVEHGERKIFIIYPEFMRSNKADIPLQAMRISGRFHKEDLNHRDFLGSILGLGLKREKIGDIYVGDGYADVIAFKEICKYIKLYLDKVASYKVEVEDISFEKIIKPQEIFKHISGTVASLRMDAILGIGFGESRTAISKLISNDKVKVNWRVINNPSYLLKEGDVISFKGKGRIILEKIDGKTKKERYKISIKRMI